VPLYETLHSMLPECHFLTCIPADGGDARHDRAAALAALPPGARVITVRGVESSKRPPC